MKILHHILRVILVLVLVTPVLGALGVGPAPTADLYSPEGWAFMEALINTGYMMYLLALLCAVCIVFTVMNKMALVAIMLLPMTVNVMLFHNMDTGLFTSSTAFAWPLFIANAFFLWDNRKKYKALW